MTILLWSLLGLLLLLVVAHVVAWALYVPIAVRIFDESPWLSCKREDPIEDGEHITFSARDGHRLEGTYLATTRRQRLGVILYCHELMGDRWNAVPYVASLLDEGYDVFTFDFRNHGDSDASPNYQPMPWTTQFELMDVRAAVDYLAERSDADPRGVFVWGVSRGGTAALCALGKDCRVRALAVDGLVPTEQMQLHFTRRFMGIYLEASRKLWENMPEIYIRSLGFWTRMWLTLRKRCRFVNVSRAARQATVPVMLIHGERDSYVPIDCIERVRRGMRTENSLWLVKKTKHNGAIRTDPEGYLQRVRGFFSTPADDVPAEPAGIPLARVAELQPE